MTFLPIKILLALLIALFVVGILLLRNARFHNSKELFKGLKPGVAMEFLHSREECNTLLGSDCSPDGIYNRNVMRRQQHLDFIFIPLYALFLISFSSVIQPKWLSTTAILVIILAGIFDYLEDFAILAVCNGDSDQKTFPVAFGVPKWLFFFLALAFLAYALMDHRNLPVALSENLPVVFARVVGGLFALSALLGIPGVLLILRSRQGQLLNIGVLSSFTTFLAILAFFLLDLIRHQSP